MSSDQEIQVYPELHQPAPVTPYPKFYSLNGSSPNSNQRSSNSNSDNEAIRLLDEDNNQYQSIISLPQPALPNQEILPIGVLHPGLVLVSTCDNQQCQNYNSDFYICKSFNEFHLQELNAISKCPVCRNYIPGIKKVGYFNAKITLTGKRIDMFERLSFEDSSKNLKFYEEYGDTKPNWHYMRATTTKLSGE